LHLRGAAPVRGFSLYSKTRLGIRAPRAGTPRLPGIRAASRAGNRLPPAIAAAAETLMKLVGALLHLVAGHAADFLSLVARRTADLLPLVARRAAETLACLAHLTPRVGAGCRSEQERDAGADDGAEHEAGHPG